jgi:hypothetical protein
MAAPRARCGLLAAALVLRAGALGAQAGGSGGVLLQLPATAREMALGGAYTAVIGDAGALFVNPAGLAPVKRNAVAVSHERYLLGTTLTSAALAVRISKFDLGVGVHLLDFGGDSAVVPDPAFGGDRGLTTGATIGAYHALGIGTVTYRRGLLSAGVSVKGLREHVGVDGDPASNVSAVAVDVGLVAAFFDIAAIGVVAQNLGGDIRGGTAVPSPLPRTVRVGYMLNVWDPQGVPRLMVTAEWVGVSRARDHWAFGVEGGVVSGGVGLLGRLGAVSGRRDSDRSPLTAGGGIVFHGFRLDYAYQALRALGGGTHRFTAGWMW